MGMLDSVLGGLLGGSGGSNSPMGSILGELMGGAGNQQSSGGIGGALGGMLGGGGGGGMLGGLLGQVLGNLRENGHGGAVESWLGNGPNQPVDPGALRDAIGPDKLNQWSQQTGMGHDDILNQLSQLLPHAVDRMTPGDQQPGGQESSPFDGPGMP